MTEPPDISWFQDPGLTELTPLTVSADGRCYGHICGWGTRHRGLSGNITPPRSRSDYANFLLHSARVADGDEVRTVAVGNLTMGTNHAAMNLDMRRATDHYDVADSAVAQVAVGEDAVGVWFSGAILPDVDELRLRRFMSCGLSGDWRADPRSGALDLCAVLSCPVPGFPIPRARVASGAPLSLVAAGALAPPRGLASFSRRVDPAWTSPLTSALSSLVTTDAPAGARLEVTTDGVRLFNAGGVDVLADAIASRLDERKAAGELSAAHAALVVELDDTPAVVAALLAEVDDTPQAVAALLAELADDDFLSKMPPQLQAEWLAGGIAARIAWGTPGAFGRCQVIAREKQIPGRQIDGMCANLKRAATGSD